MSIKFILNNGLLILSEKLYPTCSKARNSSHVSSAGIFKLFVTYASARITNISGLLLLFNVTVHELISLLPCQPINMQLLVKTSSSCNACFKASVEQSLVPFMATLKCNKPRARHRHRSINCYKDRPTSSNSNSTLSNIAATITIQAAAQLVQQPVTPQVIPFAMAPIQAFQIVPLNFETSVGLEIWEHGT